MTASSSALTAKLLSLRMRLERQGLTLHILVKIGPVKHVISNIKTHTCVGSVTAQSQSQIEKSNISIQRRIRHSDF